MIHKYATNNVNEMIIDTSNTPRALFAADREMITVGGDQMSRYRILHMENA